VLRLAAEEAERSGDAQIRPKHLLIALLKDGGPLVTVLFDTIGLDPALAAGMLNELEGQGIAGEDEPDDAPEDGE
jgi:hypothetical protein